MFDGKKIYDISLPIREGMITYTGNPEVVFEEYTREKPGSVSTHTKITLGSHAGTHVDAPRHVLRGGAALGELPLDAFVGLCRVLDMTDAEDAIHVSDVEREAIQAGERLLFKTKNSAVGFETFRDDYVYLDGDAADFLAEQGIALAGIDALSIKQRGSADLRAHTSFLSKNIPILEGIDLSAIAAGAYTLVCLPLRLAALDGAPARAVLIEA